MRRGHVTTSAVIPTVTTLAAGGITTSGATLNGTVNVNNQSTTVTFRDGPTSAYGTHPGGGLHPRSTAHGRGP